MFQLSKLFTHSYSNRSFITVHNSPFTCSNPWVSNRFIAKGHTRYCGLVREANVEKITGSATPNCLNYYVIFIVYTVEPGYNDIGLYISSTASDILWYQLIPLR
jgi:hypothetical protein